MDKRNNANMYNNQYQPMMPPQNDDIEDALYPEIYKKLAPVVDQLISDMEKQYGDIELTDDLLNRMADEVIRRAKMMPQPWDMEAIPAINDFRSGYSDRNNLSDILRIILLQQIFGGHRRPRWRRRR